MKNETKKLHLSEDLDTDWYKVLEIEVKSTPKQIQDSYRRLARKYHPDANKKESSIEKFNLINEAYQVLSDNQSRKIYDWERGLVEKIDPRVFSVVEPTPNLIDFINRTLDYKITDDKTVFLDLWKSARDKLKDKDMWSSAKKLFNVTAVARFNSNEILEDIELSVPIDRYTSCSVCGGTSSIGHKTNAMKCYYCNGTGLEIEKIFVVIKIPAKTKSGKLIKIPGRGHSTPVGLGDLIVRVEITSRNFWDTIRKF